MKKNNLLIEKKSKFYFYSFEVSDEKEVKNLMENIKREHPKATHIVYAFKLSNLVEKGSNSKEPHNSALKPLIRALNVKEATNTLIIVARYYGGIKLGVGPLSRSYFQAAISALEK